MKDSSHLVFVIFLLLIGVSALASLSVKGCNYYLTPLGERPFRPDYPTMKPSGYYSHALGIMGGTMITVGVALYSTRKRVRSLWSLGKLSRWLEFHIFLCLVGPLLVVYHTTFKAGGIASISLWTMLSVAASGLIGRFLYVQIPRNLNGNELTMDEVNAEIRGLGSILRESPVGAALVAMIDSSFTGIKQPSSLLGAFSVLFNLERMKGQTRRGIREIIGRSNISHDIAKQLHDAAISRATLVQRSLVLSQVERLFFYWHAIHLPFTVIMFITLAAHVTVSILLGYTWIF